MYILIAGRELRSFITGGDGLLVENDGFSRLFERSASIGGRRVFVYKKILYGLITAAIPVQFDP
jgi:hypothetical protein